MKSTILISLIIVQSLVLCLGCSPTEVVKDNMKEELKEVLKNAGKKKLSHLVKKTFQQKFLKGHGDHQETIETAQEKFNHGKIEECIDDLKPLVDQLNFKALFLTGKCYSVSTRFKDLKKAASFYRRAVPGLKILAAHGDVDALYYLGGYEMENGHTAEGQAKLQKAISGIRAKANQGDAHSQQRLASMYHFGWGVNQDYAQAFKWFQKCESAGYAYTHFYLGHYYLRKDGRGVVKPSLLKAKKHFQVAADKGFALAQTELGWQLYHSKSSADRERGLTLLVQAKLQQEPIAAKLLASISKSNSDPKTFTRRKTESKNTPKTEAEVKSFVKKVSRAVGRKIMESIGGGQDLVVSVKAMDYDSINGQYEIDILVSFNGKVFRSDNYRVAGRITVNHDGTGARFAKTASNANFKEWEGFLTFLAIAEVVAEAVND